MQVVYRNGLIRSHFFPRTYLFTVFLVIIALRDCVCSGLWEWTSRSAQALCPITSLLNNNAIISVTTGPGLGSAELGARSHKWKDGPFEEKRFSYFPWWNCLSLGERNWGAATFCDNSVAVCRRRRSVWKSLSLIIRTIQNCIFSPFRLRLLCPSQSWNESMREVSLKVCRAAKWDAACSVHSHGLREKRSRRERNRHSKFFTLFSRPKLLIAGATRMHEMELEFQIYWSCIDG